MDQGLVATRMQRKIPEDGSYAQLIGTQHKADDGYHKPVKGGSSGKAGTKLKQNFIDEWEHRSGQSLGNGVDYCL
ncbi:hypothetical protein [Paenibacillus durus]|uniref:hypothetical protein n=1 Tax=Paenibacillus durus TaxID=44251 RepID=UPI001E35B767|nr:hypothetical protein [Paenibacillus durus]